MTPTKNTEAFNVTETCARLGRISRKTFYELVNAGELKTFKIGNRRYVSAAALADFIERKESAA